MTNHWKTWTSQILAAAAIAITIGAAGCNEPNERNSIGPEDFNQMNSLDESMRSLDEQPRGDSLAEEGNDPLPGDTSHPTEGSLAAPEPPIAP